MDIHIESNKIKIAPPTREELISYLQSRYEKYPFITAIELQVSHADDKEMKVSLMTKPEKGKVLFVSSRGTDLMIIVNHCRNKLDFQIEKYKEVHYHNAHASHKNHQ